MGDFRRTPLLRPRTASLALLLLTLAILLSALRLYRNHPGVLQQNCPQVTDPPVPCPPMLAPDETAIELITSTAAYFARYPPRGPLKDQFGERGQRAVALKKWISLTGRLDGAAKILVEQAIELAAPSIFPFLADPPSGSSTPVQSLREVHIPNTRGIVIPVGAENLRLACHLVASLLRVHETTLQIEIAYAGEEDLSEENREVVGRLFPGARIRFLDVLGVFNDSTLELAKGGWAIKPFAALASSFSEVILADADTVFVQPPEVLFEQPGYASKGALLFHDRLIDKGRYMARNKWWRTQVVNPSPEVEKSLAWRETYAEEGDSGVVVVDKARLGVWVGIMHAAWQNSKGVREEVTYRAMYGDKESWWFGLELTEGEYQFERYYGGIAGWFGDKEGIIGEDEARNYGKEKGEGKNRTVGVCSYVIAHVDGDNKLLWYNGSLLRNKQRDAETYLIPTHWMINGTWDKGLRGQFSCMRGGLAGELTEAETSVLERSVEAAKVVDAVVR